MMKAALTALTVLLSAVPSVASPVSEQEVNMAKEALELLYIREGIYFPVRCNVVEIEDQTFVRCALVGSDLTDSNGGGVYLVEPGPKVFAVNGKAIEHMGRADEGVITTADGASLPIGRWFGPTIGVVAVLEILDAN